MADKGARDTTIQDITERADVAFGSFYNHFTAKEAILGTVVNDALEMHARTVDELIAEIDDPLGIGDRADLDLHD